MAFRKPSTTPVDKGTPRKGVPIIDPALAVGTPTAAPVEAPAPVVEDTDLRINVETQWL